MAYKFRGSLKNTKEIVDIIEFVGRIAKCGDGISRDIDKFNTIFYPSQLFKEEVLGVIEKIEEYKIEEVAEEVKFNSMNKKN